MTQTSADIYYDPYDFDIDDDPYPVWKRLRDEAPALLQREVRLLRGQPLRRRRARASSTGRPTARPRARSSRSSRRTSRCRRACSSSRTRPTHDLHRGLLLAGCSRRSGWPPSSPRSGSSAPRRLDPLVGQRRLRLHRRPRGRRCPMRDDRHAARHPRGGPGGGSATASTRACASRRASCPTSRLA